MTETTNWRGMWGLIRAVIFQLCPICRQGRVFRRGVTMNETCPVCNHRFEEDGGFFLGAMYISYPLATAALAMAYFGLAHFVPTLTEFPLFVLSVIVLMVCVIPIFRYSRILWMHFISTAR